MNRVRASVWMMVISMVAVLLMVIVPMVLRASQPTERSASVQLCRVELGSIEQITALTGVVRYAQEYAAISPVTGIVEAVCVQEGEAVRKGQPLVRLESSVQEAMVSEALSQQATTQVFAGENDYSMIVQAAEQERASALKQTFAAMEAMTIRAESDGIVQQIAVSEHGGVAAGSVCMVMSSDEQRIRCQAVVKDAAMIREGMMARILYDEEAVCSATVESIGPAETSNGQAVCVVELVPDAYIDLPLGAMVTAEIIVQEAENVPVLPISAVVDDQQVRWLARDRVYEVPVSVLMSDETRCWVDLPVGTAVVLQGDATVDGQQVREAGH